MDLTNKFCFFIDIFSYFLSVYLPPKVFSFASSDHFEHPTNIILFGLLCSGTELVSF